MEILFFYYLIATALCVVLTTAVRWSKTAAMSTTQLVPAKIIRTQVISYLDCTSLCKISMTNSLMRKAANNDNVWKALYHKDFWLEQDAITPENGWKAYYAATRAIMNVTTQFYKNGNTKASMSKMWLNADYVTCIQSPGSYESGYGTVIRRGVVEPNLEIREIRVRVMKDIGWLTLKFFNPDPYHISNVFEYHNGRWYSVLLHCSAAY